MECVETVVKKRVNIQKCFAAQICSVCVCVWSVFLYQSVLLLYIRLSSKEMLVFLLLLSRFVVIVPIQ